MFLKFKFNLSLVLGIAIVVFYAMSLFINSTFSLLGPVFILALMILFIRPYTLKRLIVLCSPVFVMVISIISLSLLFNLPEGIFNRVYQLVTVGVVFGTFLVFIWYLFYTLIYFWKWVPKQKIKLLVLLFSILAGIILVHSVIVEKCEGVSTAEKGGAVNYIQKCKTLHLYQPPASPKARRMGMGGATWPFGVVIVYGVPFMYLLLLILASKHTRVNDGNEPKES